MDAIQLPARPKILIIRFNAIGDIILTTPVIRAIHHQIKQAEIHILVNQKYQNVLANNPYISKIHTYSNNKNQVVEQLKTEQFNFVLDLQNTRKSHKICHQLNLPHSSFNKLKIKKLIYTRLKINTLPLNHIVDRYFDAAKPLLIVNDGQGLDFNIPETEKFNTDNLPIFFEDGFIAILLDADKGTKKIPINKLMEIIPMLLKPVVLIGDKNSSAIGDELVNRLGDRVYNICGQLSVNQYASLIDQSLCVLTGDNDYMQVAAALRKPICSLWGSSIPEFGNYPYMPTDRELFRMFEICSIKCRPCGKRGFRKCPHRNFKCMNRISSFEVAEWINQF
ncbi:MAG: glycosyltransferase family 9 protein [Bacteroidales bacterium]|nr:glycosyltransferase family 9 protein [Bacteroidales bacterium]